MTEGGDRGRTGTAIAGFELTVRDLERATNFYSSGLGLGIRAREEHGDFREVQLVGAHDTPAILLVARRQDDRLGDVPPPTVKTLLLTEDVRVLYAVAIAAGGEEVQAPQFHEPPGVWFANLRDPDGYIVQLVERRDRTSRERPQGR